MSIFHFKHFSIDQSGVALKVGTDAMLLGALIQIEETATNALDIGTGTGVLSLMVAQKKPSLFIDAIEFDEVNCQRAVENVKNSNWSANISILEADFLSFHFTSKYDLIFSNPPFYENGLINESARDKNAKHESCLPLDQLFVKARGLLSLEGQFWCILPYASAEKWIQFAEEIQLFCNQNITLESKPGIPKRAVLSFSLKEVRVSNQTLTIRNTDNTYTAAYKQLTIDYHGKAL